MTEQEAIVEFERGVAIATFSAPEVVHELYKHGIRAVLIPEKVYNGLKNHPSIRGWLKQDVSIFQKWMKIEGVEFYPVLTDKWQFGKIVFGDKLCSQ